MTIAECLGSISFNEIEEILWDAYGIGDNFTPFLKMTYDRFTDCENGLIRNEPCH